jgi:hypothetical protein
MPEGDSGKYTSEFDKTFVRKMGAEISAVPTLGDFFCPYFSATLPRSSAAPRDDH